MDLTVFQLDSRANDYFKQELKGRGLLAQTLARRVDLGKGSISALLPTSYTDAEAYRFSAGWTASGKQVVEPSDPRHHLVNEISTYLKRSDDRLLVIEDAVARLTDPEVSTWKHIFFHKEEVYHFLRGAQRSSVVEAVLLEANVFPGPLGILASVPDTLVPPMEHAHIESNFFEEVAIRTETIFLEAYDSQSFLIWRRTK